MWIVSQLFLQRCMAALLANVASGGFRGPLFNCWVGLYQTGTPAMQPTNTIADIVEANYDGYSRQEVIWFPPWISSSGPEQAASQDNWFSPVDAGVSNNITGVFLADAFYGGNLLVSAALANPGAVLGNPNEALKVQEIFQLPFQTIYGGPDVVS